MSGTVSEQYVSVDEAQEWLALPSTRTPANQWADDLARTVVKMSEERDRLTQALTDQETAYAALEAQYLAAVDAHAAMTDQLTTIIQMHEAKK